MMIRICGDVMDDDVYIDASGQVMGRLASGIAKDLLRGRSVYVINAGKSVISGNQKYVLKSFKEKVDRGDPYHGPFYPKTPERILKRVVRGMLPKNARGREALKRLMVYRSMPESLEGRKFVRYDYAGARSGERYTSLGKVSERLGAKAG